MEKVIEGIEVREKEDLGPVIARADHQDKAIEVNRKIFYRLPSEVQEFVLCHEVCHLRYDEHDEGRTNQLAAELYLRRAANAADRTDRERFLHYLSGNDDGDYSHIAVTAIISIVTAAVGLGYTIYGVIQDNNAGWYSWEKSTQQANMKVMLTQAFEESRKSSSRSAADFLWEILYRYDNKDASLDRFLARSENAWVKTWIAKYEKKYGFKLTDVTPVDILAFPMVKVGIGIVAALAVFLLIRKIKKNS